jgi:formylmethanofuran dehydrogenase subunit E
MNLQMLLEKSCLNHSHLCPRQILGVRLGLAGLSALGLKEPPDHKRLLVIVETDGCFADGVSAATDCVVGHRTLRIEDLGKTAAVFADTRTGQTLRLAPQLDIRQKAACYAPDEPRPYFAQMCAYQVMPAAEMFTVSEVILNTPVDEIVSRPGVRVNCSRCGEEIINAREIIQDGQVLCRTCAGAGYYLPVGYDSCPSYIDTLLKQNAY